jgi:hypothetical protein
MLASNPVAERFPLSVRIVSLRIAREFASCEMNPGYDSEW